jgi:hypothetical protein
MAILTAASVVALGASAASAGTYTLIAPYSGAGTTTSVLGVNDAGYMTGAITNADGSSSGFIRDPAGVYTIFSDGFGTVARNISNTNTITGYATDNTSNLATDTLFQRSSGGAFTTLVNPNTSQPLSGIAQGQNASGAIVGDYMFTSGGSSYAHGFILNGASFTDLSTGAAPNDRTEARGINDSGLVVGWALDGSTGVTEGFLYSGGAYTFVQAPNPNNAGTTYFEDVNNSGVVSGEYSDADGDLFPFLYNSGTQTFTDLAPPGGGEGFDVFGVNGSGEAVLNNGGVNYLYNPAGVPEPATWAMLIAGFGGLGAVLRQTRRQPALATI